MVGGTQRRLAAIVSVDVVSYSRLMGVDETGTLERLRSHRSELIDPLIEQHGGRIVKTTGDGMLLEFPSVVASVECSAAVQEGMAERNADVGEDQALRFRVGVHLGDIIVEGDDIFGDGVNVAARLEALSEPYGLALSDDAYRQVRDRLDIAWQDGGEHEVKNIARPVHVWRWSPGARPEPAEAAPTGNAAPLVMPDKPSIAVLPLVNLSGDPEQEFLADGIAEDVITALSRFRPLFVIARNSTFTYKGRAADIPRVARELGVRYVVEGSVRKAGNRLRITAQLIDAANANHLWADRFDEKLDDIFDLQDRIAEQIVVAVGAGIATRESERARRKPPESLTAWELLQRARSYSGQVKTPDKYEQIALLRKAITLDSEFSLAHAYLSFMLYTAVMFGLSEDVSAAIAEARIAAEKAVSLDPKEPMAHLALGRLHLHDGESEMAIGEMETAITLNPNFAFGHHSLGFAYYFGANQPENSIHHFDTALRLSPRDPNQWATLMNKGIALRLLGQFEEAIACLRQACQMPDRGYLPHMHLAAALADLGRKQEARTALGRAIQFQPNLSIGFIRARRSGMHERSLNNLLDSLRRAGVPE